MPFEDPSVHAGQVVLSADGRRHGKCLLIDVPRVMYRLETRDIVHKIRVMGVDGEIGQLAG